MRSRAAVYRAAAYATAWALSLTAMLHAFDAAYRKARTGLAVPADSLIHYNMLSSWWRHGDSLVGYTLTPSPYFVDIALQLPLAAVAPDFEWFSYALALVFALLIAASLFAVMRIVFDASRLVAVTVTAATVIGFYRLAPFSLILHSFVYNHTSEVFTTLGLLALLHALFRPGAPRRRYAPAVYALAVIACVVSSPFFIATYCIPTSLALAALLGTPYVNWRRFAWFLAITVVSAVAGLVILALISRYLWPVRGDRYILTPWRAYKFFKHTLYTEPGLWRLSWAALIGAVAAVALVIVARRRRAGKPPAIFMLAFFPASMVSCVLLPLKRGAFYGPYELRYFQLPWLLANAFYVGVAAFAIGALVARRGWRLPPAPRWIAWSAAALGAAAIVLVVTLRGPLTMFGAESTTAPAIRCFADAERSFALQDGFATPYMARYLNAARNARDWQSPNLLVEIIPSTPPGIEPCQNNVLWFDGTYRGGRAKLNFLVTHGMSDDALGFWRSDLGPPDHAITCPAPADLKLDGKATFELWIWDRDDAQRELAEIAAHNNLRGSFSPAIGATSMTIDAKRGMYSGANGSTSMRSLALPSGRYRADLALAAAAPASEITVHVDYHPDLGPFPVAAGTTHAVVEFEVENRGGATSGDLTSLTVTPRTRSPLIVTGLTLTLEDQRGIDPFRIFR